MAESQRRSYLGKKRSYSVFHLNLCTYSYPPLLSSCLAPVHYSSSFTCLSTLTMPRPTRSSTQSSSDPSDESSPTAPRRAVPRSRAKTQHSPKDSKRERTKDGCLTCRMRRKVCSTFYLSIYLSTCVSCWKAKSSLTTAAPA